MRRPRASGGSAGCRWPDSPPGWCRRQGEGCAAVGPARSRPRVHPGARRLENRPLPRTEWPARCRRGPGRALPLQARYKTIPAPSRHRGSADRARRTRRACRGSSARWRESSPARAKTKHSSPTRRGNASAGAGPQPAGSPPGHTSHRARNRRVGSDAYPPARRQSGGNDPSSRAWRIAERLSDPPSGRRGNARSRRLPEAPGTKRRCARCCLGLEDAREWPRR